MVWQYTGIDVWSADIWAEVHVTPNNPAAKYASALVRRIAQDLTRFGWDVQAVMSDNGGEFHARAFLDTLAELGAEHRFIRSGRPRTNGCVEHVQDTIL